CLLPGSTLGLPFGALPGQHLIDRMQQLLSPGATRPGICGDDSPRLDHHRRAGRPPTSADRWPRSGEFGEAIDDEDQPQADGAPGRDRQRARAVREAMERLGPLYIKIGQMLSTRPDLVPEHMMKEFGLLHDRVNPTGFSDFEPVLDRELGERWRRYFRSIDT